MSSGHDCPVQSEYRRICPAFPLCSGRSSMPRCVQPGKNRRSDIELDRQFLVRDRGGDLVDLALERIVIDRIDGAWSASLRNSQITECAGTRSTWNLVSAEIEPVSFSHLNT